MIRHLSMTAASALVLAATGFGVAEAQNYTLNPNYGTVRLNSGFTPDPYWVSLQSGGSIDSSRTIGGHCRGFVANAPDVRLHYYAGSLPLIISVNSNSDTTLVVNGPDGQWYCDDDSGAGLNPSLRWNRPATGQYDIWVGTYGTSELRNATLSISELTSQ